MMLNNIEIFALCVLVSASLFAIALLVEKRKDGGIGLINNGFIYAMTITCFITTYSFYGNTGIAAHSGLMWLANPALGATGGILLWWPLLRRLIRIKKVHGVTSLSDFMSARYNKSGRTGTLVTLIFLFGIIPYMSLQIRGILLPYSLMTGNTLSNHSPWNHDPIGPTICIFMTLFTIVFGIRKLDPSESHPGLLITTVIEGIVKLAAISSIGIITVYYLNNGFEDVFAKAVKVMPPSAIFGGIRSFDFIQFLDAAVIGYLSIFFFPRMFQVTVTENLNEKHIKTAMWLIPLYLILINIFTLPIAITGLSLGLPLSQSESFVLKIPLLVGFRHLPIFIFIAGFLSGTSMVIMETTAIAAMTSNYVILPLFRVFPALKPFKFYLLQIRWGVAAVLIFCAYFFQHMVGDSYSLAELGHLSAGAVVQLVPCLMLGLFWKRGNERGAFWGLLVGFGIWAYTLIIPAFARGGIISQEILDYGPLGIDWLRPENLLGLKGLDKYSHSMFWSLVFNLLVYILCSLFFNQGDREAEIAEEFVSIMNLGNYAHFPEFQSAATIDTALKQKAVEAALCQLFPPAEAKILALKCMSQAGIEAPAMTILKLAKLHKEVERTLAVLIGASAAHLAMKESDLISPSENVELVKAYSDLLSNLKISPLELISKINYFQEKETLLKKQTDELMKINRGLEEQVKERTFAAISLAQEKQEAAVHASRLKSEFLANMSHEIRTPLNAVIGIGDLLLETPINEEQRKYLEVLNRASVGLLALINGILDLSKIESGQFQLENINFDLADLVCQTIDVLTPLAEKKNLQLISRIPPGTPVHLKGDPLRLKQIFMNLLGNSIKFTEKGNVTLDIQHSPHSLPNTASFTFTISDTGVGMTQEQLKKLFDRFIQADPSIARLHGGTGLGLNISKQLVALMGGNISAESQSGLGSQFQFCIDFKVEEESSKTDIESLNHPILTPHPRYSRNRLVPKLKILAVDDNEDNMCLILGYLKNQPYTIVTANNGAAAFEKNRSDRFDLILMDMEMPILNGYKATQAIRQWEQDTNQKSIPIIALSANGLSNEIQMSYAAGCTTHITKPVKKDFLLAVISQYTSLEESKQRQSTGIS